MDDFNLKHNQHENSNGEGAPKFIYEIKLQIFC